MRPIHILLATPGWPSGILDLASWFKLQGLAEPVVYQLQPALAFRLDADYFGNLREGPPDPEIVEVFSRQGRPLAEESRVERAEGGGWLIRDPRQPASYQFTPAPGGCDVIVLENLALDEVRRALAQRAAQPAPGGNALGGVPGAEQADVQLFPAERHRGHSLQGFNATALDEALRAAGGRFLARLVEMDPHVVGFRIEGGQLQQVRALVRAVRLFCEADVILGGPTATSHPREVLAECEADYVFAGEAEETLSLFLKLARRHNSKDLQPEIPGLSFRYGGRTWVNTLPRDGYGQSAADEDRARCGVSPGCLRNLVRPVASQQVIAANRLDWSLLENFATPFDSLFFTGGRGCPGACSFCSKLHGQEVRTKTARQLMDEITAADARLAEGAIRLRRWRLFQYVDDSRLRDREVGWAAVFDEDFFLHRKRAVEFFRLWSESPLSPCYRLSFQTNPCTLLTSQGRVHGELLDWIGRLKPMIQLGAESFHADLLARWHKRHTVPQLETVLDALDTTGQDYTVFQILTDFESTPEELLETLQLLIAAGYRRPRMRIASSPFTIPLYDSDTRATLEFSGRLGRDRVRHFTDYEQPQPGWMDPLVADMADRADAQLQWALDFAHREAALGSVFEVLLERIRELRGPASAGATVTPYQPARLDRLEEQALVALGHLREIRLVVGWDKLA
jgi:radical SAM superfamily enzyme YgiQ (UPF0313 family)